MTARQGGGGHSFEIAKRLNGNGRLIAIDRDPEAIAAVTKRLAPFSDRVEIINSNYSALGFEIFSETEGLTVFLSTSVFRHISSTPHPQRGFSDMNDAPFLI